MHALKYCILALSILTTTVCALSPKEIPSLSTDERFLLVSVKDQRLFVVENKKRVANYKISTSKKGVGNKALSEKTPLGWHLIQKKIGDGARLGSIFKYRWDTGEIAKIPSLTKKDLVTSRILHLQGLEKGKNLGPGVDSYKRCIYIHGTNEESLIGRPSSRGCIRMKNKDVIELFKMVKEGTLVYIKV